MFAAAHDSLRRRRAQIADSRLQPDERGDRRCFGPQDARSQTHCAKSGDPEGVGLLLRKAALRSDRDFNGAVVVLAIAVSDRLRIEHQPQPDRGRGTEIIAQLPRRIDDGQSVAAALLTGARSPPRASAGTWTSACLSSSRTTLRWLTIGTIRATPSSVAFCTIMSMRSPRGTHCTSVTASGDSRSTHAASPTATRTRVPRTASMTAVASRPSPLNSTRASPLARAQHLRDMRGGVARQLDDTARPKRRRHESASIARRALDPEAATSTIRSISAAFDDIRRHEVHDVADRPQQHAAFQSACR